MNGCKIPSKFEIPVKIDGTRLEDVMVDEIGDEDILIESYRKLNNG